MRRFLLLSFIYHLLLCVFVTVIVGKSPIERVCALVVIDCCVSITFLFFHMVSCILDILNFLKQGNTHPLLIISLTKQEKIQKKHKKRKKNRGG